MIDREKAKDILAEWTGKDRDSITHDDAIAAIVVRLDAMGRGIDDDQMARARFANPTAQQPPKA